MDPDATYTIVYVHGIGNKVAPPALKEQWDRNLFGRSLGDRSVMTYWADIRYEKPLPSLVAQRLQEEGLPGGAARVIEDVPADVSDDAAAQEFASGVTAGHVRYAQALHTALAKEVEPRVLGPIGDLLLPGILRLFVRDASAYFFGSDRKLIQDRLRDALDSVEDPVLVLGHSLGSIMSYDILSEPTFRNRKIFLITFGSQLGVAEVQARVRRPLEVPAPVEHWHNFFDPWDISTLGQTLADEFAPHGAIVDERVDNTSPGNHDSAGYLRTPELHALVRQVASVT